MCVLVSASLLARLLKAAGLAIIIPSSAYIALRYIQKLIDSPLEIGEDADERTRLIKSLPRYGERRSTLEHFIYVRCADVGVVLGRHSRNLRKIEYETRTFLQLVTYGPDDLHRNPIARDAYEDWTSGATAESDETPAAGTSAFSSSAKVPGGDEDDDDSRIQFIRVHAQTPQQIRLVELAIESTLEDSRRRRNSAEMRIPAETVGFIIGRNGDRIKRLNIDCRVHTRITQTGTAYETVTIEGTPEGIKAAQNRVLTVVDRVLGCTYNEGEMIEPTPEEEMKQIDELRKDLEDEEEVW